MAIVRYVNRNPWHELDQMTNRLTRVFDGDWSASSRVRDWVPAMNVEENGDELLLTAELPGLSAADVDIELENNVLTVRGEKVQENNDSDDARFHVWERRYGSFKRSLALPRTVVADDISAEFTDGILTVRMPKAPEAKGRRIAVASDGVK